MEKQEREKLPYIPRTEQWALGIMTLLAGYLYSEMLYGERFRSFPLAVWPWEALLAAFTVIFIATGLFYGYKNGKRMDWSSNIYLIFTAAAGLWVALWGGDSRQDICPYVVLFLHGAGVYWVLALSGNRLDGRLDERGLADLLRGFVLLPFGYFGRWFAALANFFRGILAVKTRHNRTAWQAAAGILLSIPVACIVVPLLMGADENFNRIVTQVAGSLFSWIGSLWNGQRVMVWVLALLICCYLFGLFYGAFGTEKGETPGRRALPPAMLTAFLAMFLALYGIFFLIKLAEVPQSLGDIRTGELLRSTYAREGFFELCWIASINFAIFALVNWYWPEGTRENRGLKVKKVCLTVLGIQTLAFILLALFRMGFYIAGFGLTFKRVFTTWFMIVLLVTFVLMTAGNWRKLEAFRLSVLFGCITFLILAYSNIPAWTAG